MKAKHIAILTAVVSYAVVGFIAAQYLAAVIYFFGCKAKKEEYATITRQTWSEHWHWYQGDPWLAKRLKFGAALAGILVYGIPLIAIASVRGRDRSLHGDARWATSSEISKSGLYGEKGLLVGKFGGRYLVFGGQQFVLLAAPTRSGKGVSVVIPNLLHYSDSVVVADTKLENFRYTSKFRQMHGHEVYLFAPFSKTGETHRWNIFDTIPKDPIQRVGAVQGVGEVFWPSDADDKSKFWNDGARNLFQGLVLYLMDTPELPCTFGEVLRQSSGKGKTITEHIQSLIADRSNGDNALSDECLDAFSRFLSNPENTLGSIVSTFNAPLLVFSNPIVDAATSATDFDISQVRKKRMSIYLGIQPKDLKTAGALMNLFFSQVVSLNTEDLPATNPELKYQCTLVMDEFTAFGKIGILSWAVSFLAGYNIRLMPIIQSISQLESVYGEKDTRNFVTNHAMQVVFPPRDQKDANDVSENLGYFTQKEVSTGTSTPRAFGQMGSNSENISSQRRALMLPQELKEMDQGAEIVLMENTKPILAEKARYYSDPVFIDRLKQCSSTLAAMGKKLPSQQELENAALTLRELSSFVPTVDVGLHKAKVENRKRNLAEGEEIDLTKLAVDMGTLPPLDDPERPSAESVEQFVDAFFATVEWVDPDTGEIGAAPSGEVVSIELEPLQLAAGGEIESAVASPSAVDFTPSFDAPPEFGDVGPPDFGDAPSFPSGKEDLDLAVLDR